MYVIPLFKTSQNGYGVLNGRLFNKSGLEPSLKGRILLNILSVLVQCGCTDTVQLASCQQWFQHVSRINGTFRSPGSHHCMQLIDKEHDSTVRLGYLLQHCFHPLFKLTSKLGACKHCTHVKGNDTLVFQPLGNIALDNTLRETFNYCSFTHTGLSDENRIVFSSARQHLNHPPDFVIPTYNGIELPRTCAFGEVNGIPIQSLISRFGILGSNPLISSNISQCLQYVLPAETAFLKKFACVVTLSRKSDEKMLCAYVLIPEFCSLFLGICQKCIHPAGYIAWSVDAGS